MPRCPPPPSPLLNASRAPGHFLRSARSARKLKRWTQSITRTRWLAVKLALTGLAAMAVTEALSLMYA
jgi:hypothetical protein